MAGRSGRHRSFVFNLPADPPQIRLLASSTVIAERDPDAAAMGCKLWSLLADLADVTIR